MTFLPIVERELRVAARQHSTYWMRMVLALAAIAIGLFLYLARTQIPPQSLAKEIFGGLGGLSLLYCLSSGRRSTADCLSEEKREGTLGLLFLTDLKGYDVVLGKLAATSVGAFYGLLAVLPVLAIPLLMGGVTNGEFWRTVLVLVNTFLFSLTIGVFASVLSRDARRAMGTNLLLLLALAAVPPAIAATIAYIDNSHPTIHPLFFSCPVYSYWWGFDVNYQGAPGYFWASVGVIHALTWLLAALSSWLVPHSWQDRESGKGEPRQADRWRSWMYGNSAQRKALRTRLLEVNPFCWLSSRARFKPAAVWVFLGLTLCWWLYLRLVMHLHWAEESFSLTTVLLLNSVLKLWIGIEASQRLAEEQKMGSLELLLSTPLRADDILCGQFLALKRQFLRPMAVVLAVEAVFIIAGSLPWLGGSQDRGERAAYGIAAMILLILDTVALACVGLRVALTAKSPTRASASAVLRIMILPWLMFIAVMVIASIWTAGGPGPGWKFSLHLWFWLGVSADLAFGLPAWRQLRTRFRELALQRFAASPIPAMDSSPNSSNFPHR